MIKTLFIVITIWLGITAIMLSEPVFSAPLVTEYPKPLIRSPAKLSFNRLALPDFITTVYADILGESVTLDPAIITDTRLVTLYTAQPLDDAKIRSIADEYLRGLGLGVNRAAGVVSVTITDNAIKNKPEIKTESLLYRMKYRPLSYFADLLPTLYPDAVFSFKRSVSRSSAFKLNASNAASVDTGDSAYSKVSKDSDMFVVQAPPAQLEKISAMLAMIDKPESQVMVKAVVYEVSSGDASGSGFKLALSLFDGRIGIKVGQGTGQPFDGSVGISASNIEAIIGMFQSDNRFKLISTPILRVRSGENGRFNVGEQVPVLGSVQQDKNGNAIQSVEYRDSGVILDISPQVREKQIDLNVTQTLSSFVPTKTGVNNSPTLLKRELSTALSLADGEVVMIGGLTGEISTGSKSGMPWLPDFLQTKSDSLEKKELLLFIQATKI